MKSFVLLLTVCLVGLATATVPSLPRFDDFKLYKVKVEDKYQLEDFKKLGNDLPVIYLNEVGKINGSFDIVIDPEHQEDLEEKLNYLELKYNQTVADLQGLLDQRETTKKVTTTMEWTKYHTLDEIYGWLDYIQKKHKSVVSSFTIGTSYEGRPIRGIKISYKKKRKAIFIDSNIHAIEWISSATTSCFIDQLLNSKDKIIRNLAKKYDWIYVPIVNPDGFVYTHNVHPLWRKNRKPTGFSNSSGICYGTDLNRNFNVNWGLAAYNIDVPCDHWYGGSEPDSEPEVQALEAFLKSFKKDYIRMYLAFHSYGNLLLLPYGHTTTVLPPNYNQMLNISRGFADAAIDKHGTDFLYGASGLLNYPVSGSAKDWAYEDVGIPYSATVELRDRGEYGFFLPANQILEVCEEVTDGMIGMIAAAEQEKLFD